jgi:hypothetical protein
MTKKIGANSTLLSGVVILLLFSCRPSEKVPEQKAQRIIRVRNVKMENLLGINAFEWDFLQDFNNPYKNDKIIEHKFDLIRSFGLIRHYMDWEKIEDKPGQYSFNPTTRGGWNYDVMYQRLKDENIDVLVCFKGTPDWLYKTYPKAQQDYDNAPLPYKADREAPKSYISMGKAAYQFAARYGSSHLANSKYVKVNGQGRWTEDALNVVKTGLNTVKYIECNNEPDKWWKGKRAQQTAKEYAANLSAFYDGHKGTLGKNVGVKSADSNMVVLMGGLGRPNIEYVKEIVEWCKENRGYKPDGSINLCFDVLNYHLYSNDNTGWFGKFLNKKRGVAPELTNEGPIADTFVDYAETLGKQFEVWITESGYDLSKSSVQRAIPIGDKSELLTQADWALRSSLLYARHGVNRATFYQLYDTDPNNGVFGSSGFVEGRVRRPSADYFIQTKNLMGHYTYDTTIGEDPIVDLYQYKGKKMYILVVPDEKDRREEYELDLGKAKTARVHYLKPGKDQMIYKDIPTNNGSLTIEVTETPIFIEPIG